MANFFEGVWEALKHPFSEIEWMAKSTRDVVKGDMDLKDIPGSHQRMMNKITVPILGDNKVAKNSDAIVGAVIGSIAAAPYVSSMFGGSGAPGVGGSEFANSGFSFTGKAPTNTGLEGGVGWKPGNFGNDFGSPTFKPSTEFADMAKAGVTDPSKGMDWQKALQAFSQMAPRTGQQKQSLQHSGPRVGGGTNIQTEDQYAAAMKALVDKYGQFMFNKNF